MYITNIYENYFHIDRYVENLCKDKIDDAKEVRVEQQGNELNIYIKLDRFNDSMFAIIRKYIKELQYLDIIIIDDLRCVKMEMSADSHMHVHFEASMSENLLNKNPLLLKAKNES